MAETERRRVTPLTKADLQAAVRAGIEAWWDAQQAVPCYQRCDRVTTLESDVQGHHKTLYGEDGRGGLTGDIAELGSSVRAGRRAVWIAVGAAIAAVPSGVLSLILYLASRGG